MDWVHTNRQNYNGKHMFYPCSVDNLFCSVYLQGEVQGYADRIEWSHNHPSITNTISRVCLGVTDDGISYHNEHPWYSNLVSYKYDVNVLLFGLRDLFYYPVFKLCNCKFFRLFNKSRIICLPLILRNRIKKLLHTQSKSKT